MVQLQRFAARPITIDAVQVTEYNLKEIHQFLRNSHKFPHGINYVVDELGNQSIQTSTQSFRASIDDWIVWEERFGGRFDVYTNEQMQREYVPTSNLTLNQYFGNRLSVVVESENE